MERFLTVYGFSINVTIAVVLILPIYSLGLGWTTFRICTPKVGREKRLEIIIQPDFIQKEPEVKAMDVHD